MPDANFFPVYLKTAVPKGLTQRVYVAHILYYAYDTLTLDPFPQLMVNLKSKKWGHTGEDCRAEE